MSTRPRSRRGSFKRPSVINALRSSGGKSLGAGKPKPQQVKMQPKRYRRRGR